MTSRTVWLIDDELPIRSVLSRRFESMGYTTHTAASAEQGLELLEHGLPDAIVVDLQMPGMTGVEFAMRLSERVDRSPPILLLTARSHLAAEDELRTAGIRRVMVKPFSAREIVREIELLLETIDQERVA
ncbi:MAG: response regulator [Planctomycetota bacterium]